jgi:uridine kinase
MSEKGGAMSINQPSPPWRVLLVGGASGAGKTVLAQALH